MCKSSLRVEQMNPTAFVNHTVELNRRLVNGECRGPGDLENAMRRVEQKWGIPVSVSWALRYRKPKTIAADIYARHVQAVETFRETQLQRLQDERTTTKATNKLAAYFVRAAAAVVGEIDQ
jgi:hypothetical protein